MNERQLPSLFIGCSTESLRAAKALQNNLQYTARAMIWTQDTFRPSRVTINELQRAAHNSDFAAFILAPDDFVTSRVTKSYAPRDNTIFEVGFFMGVLGVERVFLVKPRTVQIKLPTDLQGITPVNYDIPEDERWESALGIAANKIEQEIQSLGSLTIPSKEARLLTGPHATYTNINAAINDIRDSCKRSTDIKVFANKGLAFIGTDDSVLSTAEIDHYHSLRKIRIILLSPHSRWITKGLMTLRKHESLATFIREMKASHQIVEHGIRLFSEKLSSTRSGVKYHFGEPNWRMVITDYGAFVSSYADNPNVQSRDLLVSRYDNEPFSFYSVFKRHFNDVWHNTSAPGEGMKTELDLTTSAGGIVYAETPDGTYFLILQRTDGYWVFPKGHKKISDTELTFTAIREIAEESGLEMNSLIVEKKLDVYVDSSFEHEGKKKVVHLYLLRYSGTELPRLVPDPDHVKAVWWPVTKPMPNMLYPYQKTLISEVFGIG